MSLDSGFLSEHFRAAPPMARKLFLLIAREAHNGPIRSKAPGVATPPEILEACGIDVGEFYSLLAWLKEQGLIQVAGDYPFEEIRLTAKAQEALPANFGSIEDD